MYLILQSWSKWEIEPVMTGNRIGLEGRLGGSGEEGGRERKLEQESPAVTTKNIPNIGENQKWVPAICMVAK